MLRLLYLIASSWDSKALKMNFINCTMILSPNPSLVWQCLLLLNIIIQSSQSNL